MAANGSTIREQTGQVTELYDIKTVQEGIHAQIQRVRIIWNLKRIMNWNLIKMQFANSVPLLEFLSRVIRESTHHLLIFHWKLTFFTTEIIHVEQKTFLLDLQNK